MELRFSVEFERRLGSIIVSVLSEGQGWTTGKVPCSTPSRACVGPLGCGGGEIHGP